MTEAKPRLPITDVGLIEIASGEPANFRLTFYGVSAKDLLWVALDGSGRSGAESIHAALRRRGIAHLYMSSPFLIHERDFRLAQIPAPTVRRTRIDGRDHRFDERFLP